jgi:hypothetical protein
MTLIVVHDRPAAYATLADMEAVAPARIVSSDSVELSVYVKVNGDFQYFVCGQEVARRTAETNLRYINARNPVVAL